MECREEILVPLRGEVGDSVQDRELNIYVSFKKFGEGKVLGENRHGLAVTFCERVHFAAAVINLFKSFKRPSALNSPKAWMFSLQQSPRNSNFMEC